MKLEGQWSWSWDLLWFLQSRLKWKKRRNDNKKWVLVLYKFNGGLHVERFSRFSEKKWTKWNWGCLRRLRASLHFSLFKAGWIYFLIKKRFSFKYWLCSQLRKLWLFKMQNGTQEYPYLSEQAFLFFPTGNRLSFSTNWECRRRCEAWKWEKWSSAHFRRVNTVRRIRTWRNRKIQGVHAKSKEKRAGVRGRQQNSEIFAGLCLEKRQNIPVPLR